MEGKERNLNYLSIRRNLDGENSWKKFLALKSENPAEFFGSNYLLFGGEVGGGGINGVRHSVEITTERQHRRKTGRKIRLFPTSKINFFKILHTSFQNPSKAFCFSTSLF